MGSYSGLQTYDVAVPYADFQASSGVLAGGAANGALLGIYNIGGVDTFTISGIPQTYTHLKVEVVGGTVFTVIVLGRINGDATNNSNWTFSTPVFGTWQTVNPDPQIGYFYGANNANCVTFLIPHYSESARFKSYFGAGGYANSSECRAMSFFNSMQNGSSPVTSLVIRHNNLGFTTFSANTKVYLYGLK